MTGLAAMVVVAVLTALHVPVALALLMVAALGLVWTGGLGRAVEQAMGLMAVPDLLVVPLVLMLGNLAFYAGLATRVHDAATVILQGRRGGLAVAALLGCAGFAATSGSSVGCAATMSRIAVPPMLRAGYDPRLAGAVVALGSTSGALLPPSMLLIVWALLSGTPVASMFLAGLVPALVSLAGMLVVVLWWVRQDPGAAPLPRPMAISAWAAIAAAWPAPVLFAVVVGGLLSGMLGAPGAVAICLGMTLAVGAFQRRLTGETLWLSVRETVRQAVAMVLILVTARLFLVFLELAGTPDLLAGWMEGIPRQLVVLGLGLACVALGLVVEPLAMLVLALPFALALSRADGVDPVWGGVVLVKLVEMAMILPPLGLIVIVIARAVGGVSPQAIFAGVGRFLFVDLLVLAALVLFPALALAIAP